MTKNSEKRLCGYVGDAFLAVTGSAKIKVFDRDCSLRGESLQGDMYIRDQRNTKGHVSPCTYGQWHPTDRFVLITMLGAARSVCSLKLARAELITVHEHERLKG